MAIKILQVMFNVKELNAMCTLISDARASTYVVMTVLVPLV